MFWFIKRKTFLASRLVHEMTDLHAPLLPGENGGPTESEALQAVKNLEDTGIKRLFLTSRIGPESACSSRRTVVDRFARFRSVYRGNVALRLGAEYVPDKNFSACLLNELFTYDGRHVLIKIPAPYWSFEIEALIYQVVLSGYVPVISNPECFAGITKSVYYRMKNRDCKLLMNLSALGGYYGREAAARCRMLLRAGFYDFAGSGCCSAETGGMLAKICLRRPEEELLRRLLEQNKQLWIEQA